MRRGSFAGPTIGQMFGMGLGSMSRFRVQHLRLGVSSQVFRVLSQCRPIDQEFTDASFVGPEAQDKCILGVRHFDVHQTGGSAGATISNGLQH